MGMLLMLFTFQSCDKEIILPANQVPDTIQAYVSQHFPDETIVQTVKDKDNFTITFDVTLSNGVQLEFNKKKEIIEMKSTTELPESVIPAAILTYVSTNYPTTDIISWELTDRKNQKVGLTNQMELIFDMSGNFVRIDD